MKVEKIEGTEHEGRGFICPGCEMYHVVVVKRNTHEDGPTWGYNWDDQKPTFTPSILVRWEMGHERKKHVCHSFVREGRIQFLRDCTHDLAGETVELPDIYESE